MRSVTIYRYSLPMEAGVILRYQRLKTRDGLLIRLQEGNAEGWGEIAPLAEFSQETLFEAEQATLSWLQAWKQGQLPNESKFPSVAFAISCALLELAKKLPELIDYRTVMLCHGDPDQLIDQLNSMPGKKVVKLKVGLYEAVRDGMIVNTLLQAIPDLKVRLDANRSWSLAKASDFAKYVATDVRHRIDFIEEPCKTREESRQFAVNTGIAIAWDESVREVDFVVKKEPGVVAIIIKPTLIGSIQCCQNLVQQAQQLGLQVMMSSSIESSFGLTQLARIASWLTPETIPGLDTLSLMQAQLIRRWPGSPLPLLTIESLDVVWQS